MRDLVETKVPVPVPLAERLENIATGKEPRIAHIYKTCWEAAQLLKAIPSSTAIAPAHLQDAPRTLRNAFDVTDPNDPKKTVKVVFASFAVCMEREANQLRATTVSASASSSEDCPHGTSYGGSRKGPCALCEADRREQSDIEQSRQESK